MGDVKGQNCPPGIVSHPEIDRAISVPKARLGGSRGRFAHRPRQQKLSYGDHRYLSRRELSIQWISSPNGIQQRRDEGSAVRSHKRGSRHENRTLTPLRHAVGKARSAFRSASPATAGRSRPPPMRWRNNHQGRASSRSASSRISAPSRRSDRSMKIEGYDVDMAEEAGHSPRRQGRAGRHHRSEDRIPQALRRQGRHPAGIGFSDERAQVVDFTKLCAVLHRRHGPEGARGQRPGRSRRQDHRRQPRHPWKTSK